LQFRGEQVIRERNPGTMKLTLKVGIMFCWLIGSRLSKDKNYLGNHVTKLNSEVLIDVSL